MRHSEEQKQQGQKVVEKWSDCVDDLWVKHFPHLREIKYNSSTGHYVQQGDQDDSAIDELAFSLEKDEEEKVGDIKLKSDASTHMKDVQQEEAGNANNSGCKVIDAHMYRPQNDICIFVGVPAMIFLFSFIAAQDLPSLARKFTVADVADFLAKIKMSQYVESFKNEEISGDTLLEGDPEMFEELKVTSHLHQMKIAHLFRKELKGSTTKYYNEHLSQFLQECKLDKHIPTLKENSIDGDMILEADSDLLKKVLEEIGITSSIHRNRIISKYKTFVSES